MALPLQADDDDAARIDAQEAMQDALLLERVLHGDADAYGSLVSKHMRRAFAVAFRILEHREDAEDVVQNSFIRALESIEQLDRSRPFRPWLLRIVVNQALNYRRGRTLRATDAIPDRTASLEASPDRHAERSELRTRLKKALDALPEKQRTIVQLADLEDMTSGEIGRIMDMPDGTVRWHLREARQKLRLGLAADGEDS